MINISEIIEKWRDSLVNPKEIVFKSITIDKIVSYPPAGNDVFECAGKYKNKKTNFILKIERSKMANFENEVEILNLLRKQEVVPKVYESGIFSGYHFIVMSMLDGDKLSTILKNSADTSNLYLFKYGQKLAEIHKLKVDTASAKQRIINDYPTIVHYKEFTDKENVIINYLVNNKAEFKFDTFIHGDFHYGNILWKNHQITGIVDWEYAGIGFKEQDIAWALILRPTQKFLDSTEEVKMFLDGYKSIGEYDAKKLKWCLINGYMHFYLMNRNGDNKQYVKKLEEIIDDFMNDSGEILSN